MLSKGAIIAILSSLPAVPAIVHPDGTGRLPALGWNSWNEFECDIDEEKVLTAANELINLGLKDLGYEYVNIDDCWSVKDGRDEDTGRIIPDPDKFPNGIDGLAEKIHDMGLKFGIYSSAGEETCADYPASLENEVIDAETFAEWGVDYLKYDNCGVPGGYGDEYNFCLPEPDNGKYPNGTCPDIDDTAPDDYDWGESKTAQRFNAMRDALAEQDRTILYSLCNWGYANVTTWGNDTGSSWRTTGDIQPEWSKIAEILNENLFLLNAVDFWGHNDADMLEVGNGDLTEEEWRSHFAIWAAMKSPLIIGTTLDEITDEALGILSNKYLIAFNQDEQIGKPAVPYKWGVNEDWTFDHNNPAEYWSGASSNGTLVLMLNSEDDVNTRKATWSEIPELKDHDAYQVTDIWTGEDLGCIEEEYKVELETHDTAALLVTGEC